MASTVRIPPQSLPEAVTRFLRHEVGDLLQTLYATVAILQKRLPEEWALERRVLSDMRTRAESCKRLIDSVHDYVCPLNLNLGNVSLAEVAASQATAAKQRFPALEVTAETDGDCTVSADERRMALVAEHLLKNACEAARSRVVIRTTPGPKPGEISWRVTDDGAGVPVEVEERLFTPFFTTRHGHPGLGLALARRIVAMHGGRIQAANLPEGGFQVQVVVPVACSAVEQTTEPA